MAQEEEKEPKKGRPPKYATREEFQSLQGSVGQILELLSKKQEEPKELTVVKSFPKKDVADSDEVMINPRWEARAREILGDALDHCEMTFNEKGGVIFTVIVARERSNAPKDYLQMYKADRRSKEIGGEGLNGVEEWCKRVKLNLNHNKN